jgi:hypothetical protein
MLEAVLLQPCRQPLCVCFAVVLLSQRLKLIEASIFDDQSRCFSRRAATHALTGKAVSNSLSRLFPGL